MHRKVLIFNSQTIVARIRGAIAASRHRTSIRSPEEPAIAIIFLDAEAALVHQRVMLRAKQHQVGEARLAARRPVLDVVGVDEALAPAAGKTAASVACPERAFDCLRHDASLATDAQRVAMLVLN